MSNEIKSSSKVGDKLWIIGCPGSGKTTLGKYLSHHFNIDCTELDALYWKANWQRASKKEMRSNTLKAIDTDSWIVIGQYDQVEDIILERADTIILIDLPLSVLLWRVLRRSIICGIKQTELWNGNHESLGRLFTVDSMPFYLLRIYKKQRQKNIKLIDAFKHRSLVRIFHCKDQKEVEFFKLSIKIKD